MQPVELLLDPTESFSNLAEFFLDLIYLRNASIFIVSKINSYRYMPKEEVVINSYRYMPKEEVVRSAFPLCWSMILLVSRNGSIFAL